VQARDQSIATPDSLEDRTVSRVFRRLMWFLILLSIAMSLDRTNIGFAALQMNKQLGLTGSQFGFAVGIVWAMLGLMMVGIETAGIATFSRMKGTPVTLGTAAKVTAYSVPLMLPWVLLGGTQLLVYRWWWAAYHLHVTLRTQQIALVGSLAVAHIGGLLWYEFTVYRGIRSVQFANR